MQNNDQNRTPSYYVRKRFFNNRPAVLGLFVIAIAHLAAILGYLIMPDSTPNANNGSLYIKKQPPIFSVTVLKERKSIEVDHISPCAFSIYGKESAYNIFPIMGMPEIKGDSVYFVMYSDVKELAHPLIQFVKPVMGVMSPSTMTLDLPDSSSSVIVDGDMIYYLTVDGKKDSVSRESLKRSFWEECVEEQTFYLGTDKSGRDMLSRIILGTRISLAIGFVSVLISLLLGVTLGAISGFFGGLIDDVVMWLMTVIWSIPSIMLVIIITIALDSKGIWVTFLAVGLTMWVDIARVVRGQILSIKEKLFIEAAKAFGLSNRRIIWKHILPNIVGPLIVICTSNFASAILVEAGLSFLGLGVKPPTPSWGAMIYDGFTALGTRGSWHLILLPSLCISLTVLAFNLFGNGLRDAYDPHAQQ